MVTTDVPPHNRGYKDVGRVFDLRPIAAARMTWRRELAAERAVVTFTIE